MTVLSTTEPTPIRAKFGVILVCLGIFFVNMSFLEDALRQAIAFSFFGISIVFGVLEAFVRVLKGKYFIYFFIFILALLYIYFHNQFVGAFGEYGKKKFNYLLFVLAIGFVALPPLLKYNDTREIFSKLLFVISIIYCFYAIVFADNFGGRRSELGLNPAILARLCMISGIYISCVMYYKGISLLRVFILLISISAVFFTATKTPVPVYLLSFYLIIQKKLNVKNKVKIGITLAILLSISYVIIINIVPETYSNRILAEDAFSEDYHSKEGNRLDLYSVAIDAIQDNPYGSGFGGFIKYHRFILVPHNIILEIAVELGLIMAVLFSIWAIKVLTTIFKNKIESINMLFFSVLFFYMLISFMFGGELTIQLLIFYILGGFFSLKV